MERVLRRRACCRGCVPGRARPGGRRALRRAQPGAARRRLAGGGRRPLCLARATGCARERVVFDVPIGRTSRSSIRCRGARPARGRMGARRGAARGHDEGEQVGLGASIAKLAACDAGLLAADRALQTFGGSGFTDETNLLQRFVYMRLLETVPVTRELALNHIATAGLGLPRSSDRNEEQGGRQGGARRGRRRRDGKRHRRGRGRGRAERDDRRARRRGDRAGAAPRRARPREARRGGRCGAGAHHGDHRPGGRRGGDRSRDRDASSRISGRRRTSFGGSTRSAGRR